jgi:CHAT domain-containing protein
LQATRRALLARPDSLPLRLRAVERELSRVRDEWEEARAEMLRLDPAHRALGPGASQPELPEIWRALGDDEAIVGYALAPHSSLGFVLRRGEVHAVRLALSGALLAGEVETLLSPLDAPLSLSTLEFDLDLSSRIRAQIIDPLLPRLEGVRRLYIVPDGPLHRLPFEALVLARSRESGGILHGEYAGASYLDERFTISYLPAASLLAAPPRPLGDRLGDRSGSLLAMGDPGGSAAGSDPGPGPARLLHSRAEIAAIAGRFPGASVWTGAEATEDRFRHLAPEFRLVHLAAHGEADEIVPLYSGFSLAADPLGREDGFLRAYEVLSIPLDCELVTLSACATGRGRAYGGEGLLGLTRCFLHAGARRAVVSLWGVNDRSTADLMERFYSGLAEGRDPAEALREAKVVLRGRSFRGPDGRTVSLAHPFFWAPFILVTASAGNGARSSAPG